MAEENSSEKKPTEWAQDLRKGIAARLEKAIIELKELEAAIKFIDTSLNPRLLADFRDATDHI